jgi:hypothetical protein
VHDGASDDRGLFAARISSPCSSAFSPPKSQTHGFDGSFQPFRDPQCGQTNPSGQRFFARYAAQEWSSGNCSWNCSSERGAVVSPSEDRLMGHAPQLNQGVRLGERQPPEPQDMVKPELE